MTLSASARSEAARSVVRASAMSRRMGSVLDARTWSHAALCVRVSYTFQSPERALSTYSKGESTIVQIVVRDNNVEQALKALKKKMQREGTFREMKRRNHYEKPSEKKARQKAEAIRRARKLARKRAQREGLLPKRGGGSARR